LLGGVKHLIYPIPVGRAASSCRRKERVCAAVCRALTVDPFALSALFGTVGPPIDVTEDAPNAGRCRRLRWRVSHAPFEGLLREIILRMKQWAAKTWRR